MIENKIITNEVLEELKNMKTSDFLSLFGNFKLTILPIEITKIYYEKEMIKFPTKKEILEQYIPKNLLFKTISEEKLSLFSNKHKDELYITNFEEIKQICRESFLEINSLVVLNMFEKHKDELKEFDKNNEIDEIIKTNKKLLEEIENSKLKLFENKHDIQIFEETN